jgi:hypothetical protein
VNSFDLDYVVLRGPNYVESYGVVPEGGKALVRPINAVSLSRGK